MKNIQRLPYKRRRLGKTNYKKRLHTLSSGRLRLVIRKSLNGLVILLIRYEQAGDLIVTSANTGELKKFGWNLHSGNIPAAYLIGLFCGAKIEAKAKKDSKLKAELDRGSILDLGATTHIKGGRVYAALKGLVDAGINVQHSKDIFPNQSRISGEHIESYRKIKVKELFEKVKNDILNLNVEFEQSEIRRGVENPGSPQAKHNELTRLTRSRGS